MSAVACDGGARTTQVTWPGENTAKLNLLIPAKALALLASLVGTEAVLYVGTTEQSAVFYDGVMTFSVRLLRGKYLDADLVFNAVQPVYYATVDNTALCQALELAATLYDADRFQLKLEADHLEVGSSSAAQIQCVNSVPIMGGNGPAAVPFYYGKTLLSSIKPLDDTLVLAFSSSGQLLVCDEHTKLFQNSMRAPSLLKVEKKPAAKKGAAAKKDTAKKTKKSKNPTEEAA